MGVASRIAVLCVALAFVGAACTYLYRDLANYSLVGAAAVLREATSLPTADEELQARMEEVVSAASDCGLDEMRSRVALALFLVKRAAADQTDLETRERRFQRSEAVLKEALACDPLDGRLWALTAALEGLAAYEPERVTRLLRMSVTVSPFEGTALSARWSFIARLPDVDRILRVPALHDDLSRAISLLPTDKALAIIRAFQARRQEALIRPLLGALSDERLGALIEASKPSYRSPADPFLVSIRTAKRSSGA